MTGYLRPVAHQGGVSTFRAHTRRTRPSQEPGVDFYCPIGTPVYAVWSGKVVAVAGGIGPATGRYVTIDLDDGRRVRYLHLLKQHVRVGQRVKRGDVIGLSGASGYGSEYFGASSPSRIPANTGGPHVHVTLWPGHWQRFGSKSSGAIDIEQHIISPASSDDRPVTPKEIKVRHYFNDDGKARRPGGVDLAPGGSTWLKGDAKAASSKADNIVGGVGEYQFTVHVYAEGTPGDVVDLVLAWDDTKTKGAHSPHFVERIEIGADGFARRNVPFARAVPTGFAVYAHLTAPARNTARVKVTRFASDALLFIAG